MALPLLPTNTATAGCTGRGSLCRWTVVYAGCMCSTARKFGVIYIWYFHEPSFCFCLAKAHWLLRPPTVGNSRTKSTYNFKSPLVVSRHKAYWFCITEIQVKSLSQPSGSNVYLIRFRPSCSWLTHKYALRYVSNKTIYSIDKYQSELVLGSARVSRYQKPDNGFGFEVSGASRSLWYFYIFRDVCKKKRKNVVS